MKTLRFILILITGGISILITLVSGIFAIEYLGQKGVLTDTKCIVILASIAVTAGYAFFGMQALNIDNK